MICRVCGKNIWGEGWDPETGRRFFSHVDDGVEEHEDGSWVEPESETDEVRKNRIKIP